MTRRELREFIRTTIKENIHGGTGGGGNPTYGNNVTSPRPFHNDEDEVDFYNKQNTGDGGQGMQTRGMEKSQGNPNRSRFTRY